MKIAANYTHGLVNQPGQVGCGPLKYQAMLAKRNKSTSNIGVTFLGKLGLSFHIDIRSFLWILNVVFKIRDFPKLAVFKIHVFFF